ncbi:MAG: permease-like cell division protein FtsX [Clostridia bacterium]|nr:permease-like cell division protein FtsX [Clostridia bacterium]
MRYNGFTYLISEGFSNVFKNKKGTMVSLITMICAMFMFGAAFAIGENVNYIMKQVQASQGIEVFILNEATDEQTNKLENEIKGIDGVSTVTYKSKEEALETAKENFKDYPAMIAGYEDEYIFPPSFIVMLTDLSKAKSVEETISTLDNVKSIKSNNDTMDTLLKIANGIRIAIVVIFAGLLVIAMTIIANTIKLTVHARRKEISIMKYVGATNSFIRGPFLVEGIIIGLIAACVTVVLITFVYDFVVTSVQASLVLQKMHINLLQYAEILKSIIIVYIVLGVGIGMLGSAFSMKKYLEV